MTLETLNEIEDTLHSVINQRLDVGTESDYWVRERAFAMLAHIRTAKRYAK